MWNKKIDEHFKKYGLLYLVVSITIVGILFYGISQTGNLGQTLIEPPAKCFSCKSKKYGCRSTWTWAFHDRPVKTNAITFYSAGDRTICYKKLKLTYIDGTIGEFDLTTLPEAGKNGLCVPKDSPYTFDIGVMKEIREITVTGCCPRKKHPRGYGGIRFLDYSEITPGPFGEKYCKDDKVYQKYRREDGSITEFMVEDCRVKNMRCENGECVPFPQPTPPTPTPTAPEEEVTPAPTPAPEYAPAIPKDWLYIIVGVIVFLGASMIISSIIKRR